LTVKVITGDCRDVLASMPAESVHCCVTSPPYWGLRDYGVSGQIGLESTYQEFVDRMVAVFREVRRVLRADGTLWLNLGDSYANDGKWGGSTSGTALHGNSGIGRERRATGLKPKDLCGIPWRVAFALQDDGWWLRQDIIWSKPNPMPESVTDRCTKAHEYVFLLTKGPRYYFDAEAIREPVAPGTAERYEYDFKDRYQQAASGGYFGGKDGHKLNPSGRNKRSVWEVATAPFSEAHFATFPPALIEPCIKAGTSEKGCCAKCGAPWVRMQERIGADGRKVTLAASDRHARHADGSALMGDNMMEYGMRGSFNVGDKGTAKRIDAGWSPSCACNAAVIPCTVLDPFGGAGTTGLVADRLQRDAILIELNPDYAEMARKRVAGDAPLFTSVD